MARRFARTLLHLASRAGLVACDPEAADWRRGIRQDLGIFRRCGVVKARVSGKHVGIGAMLLLDPRTGGEGGSEPTDLRRYQGGGLGRTMRAPGCGNPRGGRGEVQIELATVVRGSETPVGQGATGALRCVLTVPGGTKRAGILKRGSAGEVAAEAFSALLLRAWGLTVPDLTWWTKALRWRLPVPIGAIQT